MTCDVFTIKRGDRLPTLRYTLIGPDGSAQDLTGATVVFSMAEKTVGTLVVNRGASTIVTAASGIVDYAWGALDTATAGEYNGEFEATIGGLKMSFPNDGNLTISIVSDLG
ncbi:MAG: hypothetical protein ACEQSU_14885 [Microgenomates group bacterium]